jgi:sugar phosphate isomerase/epimerase
MQATNRREFLSLLAAAGAGRLGGTATKRILVGAHPWVYAATQPNYEITGILDRIFEDMSYAGMDGIELMHTALRPDNAVQRIGELSSKHNLPVIGTSFSANMWQREEQGAVLEQANLLIGRLAKLGGRTLGTSVGDARKPKTPEQLDAQAELLRRLISICESNGVVLNLHNHIYEVANNEHDLRGTLERIPDIKLGPDLDWLLGAGIQPLDFIRRYGKRIVFAHLRDRKADGAWSEAMGEGNIDYAAIGRALRELNFAGDLVIELAHPGGFHPTRPLRESLKMSREYVRRVMGY